MIYKYWLASQWHISSRKIVQVLQQAGNAEGVYRMRKEELAQICGWDKTAMENYLAEKKKWDLVAEWEKFLRYEMELVTLEDESYPVRLRHIPDPPYGLFYYGRLPRLEGMSIGIVGARRCSDYGRKMSQLLGEQLSSRGVTVISGMAEGIDAHAHVGALRQKGKTVAVLGCGADVCYPASNRTLYEKIKKDGCILSEYVPGTQPIAFQFPIRNRIISGLSDLLIVVEAKLKSGSLITADCALEQGKDVYAVPGRAQDRLSEGCNRLIKQGAGLITNVDDFIKEIGLGIKNDEQINRKNNLVLEKEEILVYSCLNLEPKNVEHILREVPLKYSQVMNILIKLQTRGYIEEVFQNNYIQKYI